MVVMATYYILIIICGTNITTLTSMMMTTFYRWVMTLQAALPPPLNLAHRWTLPVIHCIESVVFYIQRYHTRWTSSWPTSRCQWWRRSSRRILSTTSTTACRATFSSWRRWRRRRGTSTRRGTRPPPSGGPTAWLRWSCRTRSFHFTLRIFQSVALELE